MAFSLPLLPSLPSLPWLCGCCGRCRSPSLLPPQQPARSVGRGDGAMTGGRGARWAERLRGVERGQGWDEAGWG